MRWEFGSVLPADIKYNLNEQEVILHLAVTCKKLSESAF